MSPQPSPRPPARGGAGAGGEPLPGVPPAGTGRAGTHAGPCPAPPGDTPPPELPLEPTRGAVNVSGRGMQRGDLLSPLLPSPQHPGAPGLLPLPAQDPPLPCPPKHTYTSSGSCLRGSYRPRRSPRGLSRRRHLLGQPLISRLPPPPALVGLDFQAEVGPGGGAWTPNRRRERWGEHSRCPGEKGVGGGHGLGAWGGQFWRFS